MASRLTIRAWMRSCPATSTGLAHAVNPSTEWLWLCLESHIRKRLEWSSILGGVSIRF